MKAVSLRLRLTLIILLPLLLLATMAGLWQISNARFTAKGIFDRSLLSAALAVFNDVSVSGGDALLPRTTELLSDTSGGQVFYHVYAPDGVFVTGYASPPVATRAGVRGEAEISYYDGVYFGRPVRALRLRTVAQIDVLQGTYTTTVWQDVGIRDKFVWDLMARNLAVIAGLIGSLAVVVWFGINLGLRPLLELEDAISKRNSEELGTIKRPVPLEVRGIVSTLNRLLGQVTKTIVAQNAFVSNAAHQLRNPIAALMAMAEAVVSAPDGKEAKRRSLELLDAAKETGALANQLLMYERAKSNPDGGWERVDFAGLVEAAATTLKARNTQRNELIMACTLEPAEVMGDGVMLRESVMNLLDNAVKHAGRPDVSIQVDLFCRSGHAVLEISDNGHGLTDSQIDVALARFGQVDPGSGSGLGLPIAVNVTKSHGGDLTLKPGTGGLLATMTLPLADAA